MRVFIYAIKGEVRATSHGLAIGGVTAGFLVGPYQNSRGSLPLFVYIYKNTGRTLANRRRFVILISNYLRLCSRCRAVTCTYIGDIFYFIPSINS